MLFVPCVILGTSLGTALWVGVGDRTRVVFLLRAFVDLRVDLFS